MKLTIPNRQVLEPGGARGAPPENPQLAGAPYGEAAQLGKQIGAMSAELAQRRAAATRAGIVAERVSQARVDMSTWLDDREKQPDKHETLVKDAQKYQAELTRSLTSDLDQQTRGIVSQHLQTHFATEEIRARNLANRQAIDTAVARLDTSLDNLRLSASRAQSAGELKQIMDFGGQAIEAQRASGTISSVDAGRRSDAFRNTIYVDRIERDLLTAPHEVLALLKNKDNYADLRPDLRTRYIARAEAILKGRQNEYMQELRQRVHDADYALDRGYVPPDLADLAKEVKGTKLEREFSLTVDEAHRQALFALLPPPIQNEELAQMKANKSRTGQQVRMIERFEKVRDRQREDFKKDPLQLGVELGITEQLQPLDWSNPQATVAGLQERAAAATRLEGHFGQSVMPLYARETEQLKEALRTADINGKRAIFQNLHAGLGQQSKKAFARLAPDDPVTAMAGFEAARDPDLANTLLRGQAILHPNKKTDGSPDKGSLIPLPAETKMRQDFDNLTRDAFIGMDDSVRATFYQAARAVYATKAMDSGSKDTSNLDGGAWEDAIQAVTGPIEKYNGKRTLLPKGYDKSQFKTEVRKQIKAIVDSGSLADGMTYGKVDDLPLMPFGDGRYVFVVGDSHLADKQGRRIVVDLNRKTWETR